MSVLLQVSQEMQSEGHYNSQSINRKCTQLNSRWRRLQDKMADRGDKLRQAGQQEQLMDLLQVSDLKLCELSEPLLQKWKHLNSIFTVFGLKMC